MKDQISMIEGTGTSGCECAEQIPVMEASISHRSVRRSRDEDATTSGTGKRRRFGSQHHDNVFQIQNRFRRDADVNFREIVASTAVSGTSDHVNSPSFMCSVNDDAISDLKAECVSETEIFISSINDDFSRVTSESSIVCTETEETESVSTKKKKKPSSVAENEATSRRKISPVVATPSTAELEEFFSKAEEYDQKRFAERYNYDIVKDVPIEGRYQWVKIKP